MRLGIIHHAQKGGQFRAPARIEGVESRIADGRKEFARAVGTEVEEEQAVAIRQARIVADHRGGQEFVGLASA
jgi:hypothetical protein